MKTNFPYPYYFYGSNDSADQDVIIVISKEEMPNLRYRCENIPVR